MFPDPDGIFMIVVTITSLALTVKNQIGMIAAGGADWGPWAQTILGILLIFPLRSSLLLRVYRHCPDRRRPRLKCRVNDQIF